MASLCIMGLTHKNRGPMHREKAFCDAIYGIKEQVMTLQQMKYVVEIADRGSMNEAAKALYI